MEFIIHKNQIKENIGVAMRSTGYHKIEKEGQNSQLNFIKLISRSGYPRFHIYLKENKGNFVFNLHLDQKKPVYKGAKAHSGEYDGQIIKEEAERIKKNVV